MIQTPHETGVQPMCLIDRDQAPIEAFNICDVLDVVCPDWLDNYERTYAEEMELVAAWAEKWGAYHYERDKEHYSEWEAARLAAEAGKARVILHNQS
ncbi:MAG: hypothetical protein P1V51_19815 [Deltaproteobacteria bacterium]|nr:hypothetical protein [Deltaproteobacteria bacterium]